METSSVPQTDSAIRVHHKFGPSRMEYLNHCAAFQNRVSEGNEASDEGTYLHDIMAAMLQEVANEKASDTIGQLNGWVSEHNELTDEQRAYLGFCCKRCDQFIVTEGLREIQVETAIETKHEDGTQMNHGYLDVLFVYADGSAALLDFKFGWIPVPPASENLQGLNYTLAVFQMNPEIQHIHCEFVQPKLNKITAAEFEREYVFDYYDQIRTIIRQAEYVQEHPEEAQTWMHPGAYCEYCALAPSCSVLANHRQTLACRYGNLPVPAPFPSMELAKPEDWALARYWVDVIDKGLEDFKKRAKEIAEANGGQLRCTLPTGEEVVYEICERSTDRVLGSAVEVAEALKDYVTFEEVLGAATLALGNLTKISVNSMTEMVNSNLAPGEKKLTKKAAKERVESTLTALGLLSQPDTKIRYLALKKGSRALEEGDKPAEPKTIDLTPNT